MIGGVVATLVGPRWGIIGSMWIAAPLYLACAANPQDLTLTMGLITTGSLAIGTYDVNVKHRRAANFCGCVNVTSGLITIPPLPLNKVSGHIR